MIQAIVVNLPMNAADQEEFIDKVLTDNHVVDVVSVTPLFTSKLGAEHNQEIRVKRILILARWPERETD